MTNALGFPEYILNNPGPPGSSVPSQVQFNSGVPDTNGCYWYLDGTLDGWDSPDVRGTVLPRIGVGPQSDGVYLADMHYQGRPLKFCLYAECPTVASREAARNLIAQVCDMMRWAGSLYVGELVPKTIALNRSPQTKLVVIEQGFTVPQARTPGMAGLPLGKQCYPLKAEIELYAPDPHKYAATATTVNFSGSGSAAITNPGNSESQNFTVTLNSGIAGTTPFTLGLAGRSMTFAVPTLPTPPGAPPPIPAGMFIDFYNKLIQDLSANNYYYLRVLTTPWLIIPPGASTLTHSLPGNGSVSFFPAWI